MLPIYIKSTARNNFHIVLLIFLCSNGGLILYTPLLDIVVLLIMMWGSQMWTSIAACFLTLEKCWIKWAFFRECMWSLGKLSSLVLYVLFKIVIKTVMLLPWVYTITCSKQSCHQFSMTQAWSAQMLRQILTIVFSKLLLWMPYHRLLLTTWRVPPFRSESRKPVWTLEDRVLRVYGQGQPKMSTLNQDPEVLPWK